MNKSELVELLAAKTDTTQKAANELLTALIDSITQTVADGEKVMIVGFGTFEARDRKARDGRNPKTGERMKIPATTVPTFSAGKQFKDAVSRL
ncbi:MULTISPECIES: HU family DNA-binding protein [unclassified Microcoleus]|uniref:HU family DNA-binding protein n=1 Tax=unclassified Microcoleus TaxID=2642155 RepID=UPI002FD33497